jgi:hypothetical protein
VRHVPQPGDIWRDNRRVERLVRVIGQLVEPGVVGYRVLVRRWDPATSDYALHAPRSYVRIERFHGDERIRHTGYTLYSRSGSLAKVETTP